ncbi:MAG: ATP--guanido phosphotransferase [Planctomycetota bacterium]|nr:MAG: ATP--guanido phosphotransferase [Planctomycetota bacterium]
MKALKDICAAPAPWLTAPGSRQGIIVSSRIRLARNLQGRKFRRCLDSREQEELVQTLLPLVSQQVDWSDPLAQRMDELTQSERLALVERHLASSELTTAGTGAGIVLRPDQLASVMINEEDHIRIQVLHADCHLSTCLDQACAIDRQLQDLGWAFHQQYGYLTSCPTNLGTGMRASVMLHLPVLADSKQLGQVLRGLGKLHMTIRGLHGEGSDADGHFYQVSNQRTLGLTEDDIIHQLMEAVDDIVTHEEMLREVTLERQRYHIEDRVWRAWGLLQHARRIGNSEALEHLSWLRLGVGSALLPESLWTILDFLILAIQRAHLQLRDDTALDGGRRDQLRAALIREHLSRVHL